MTIHKLNLLENKSKKHSRAQVKSLEKCNKKK